MFAPLLLACSFAPVDAAGPERGAWPQWRGPDRDGTAAALPASLDEGTLTEAWRVPLGPSYSGPVADGGRVFTTETVGNAREIVKAFDAATGEQVWETAWDGALSVPFFAKANGDWIRSTPALHGGILYVGGMRDVLVALDAGSGEELWRVDFAARSGRDPEAFGHVASPLVYEDAVYAHTIAGFSKLDAKTGEVLWTVLGDAADMMSGGAFSSPIAAEIGGTPQLVVQTRAALTGVDPETGDTLWSEPVEASRGMNILTPTVVPAGGGDSLRLLTSTNGGGTMLYEVTKTGGGYEVSTVWANNRQGYMSSPVVVGGHAYQHLKNDRAVCYDLATGEAAWTTKPFGGYWSLVTDGERILALDADGELLLFPATPEAFEPAGRREITDATSWAHVAVTPGRVYVRALDALIAYDY